MKTVHAWACMKDKMVPANFLSKTSRHCCSSKMRLARSNSTCACTKAKGRHRSGAFVSPSVPASAETHLVPSVLQLGRLVELSVVEDDAGKGQIGGKILRGSRGQGDAFTRPGGTEDGRRCSLENATNLFVLVSEGAVIPAFFIDGLSYADHLWDKAWI